MTHMEGSRSQKPVPGRSTLKRAKQRWRRSPHSASALSCGRLTLATIPFHSDCRTRCRPSDMTIGPRRGTGRWGVSDHRQGTQGVLVCSHRPNPPSSLASLADVRDDPKRLSHGNKGFTLIELIVFIVLGAIILPTSFIAFSAAIKHFSRPDEHIKARFIAEAKIEQITASPFDNPPPEATSYGAVMGDATNLDSNSQCIRFCGPEYASYLWRWEIRYIDPASNPVTDVPYGTPCSGASCDYRRVSVYIRTPDGSEYSVSTVVTRRPKA
ncbi:MAG: hypothetical protein A4E65_02704 [Syntrophorhabdus sp. PtaU1.Bin153]|nr:MAG: hypothetical protein A4E65_02704 [Syntrophorhabdus sp. PtaU1.Bin153]